jgi:hypothetical protein
MASPRSPATTAIEWFVHTRRLGNLTVPIARLRVRLLFPTSLPGQPLIARWCWLDTGGPLSVVPFTIHALGLIWRPQAGVRTTWAGQVSEVGHVDIWLPTLVSSAPQGPYPLLAKFPQSDPPGNPVPILLGLDFLVAHQAALNLLPAPQQGSIVVP